MVICALAGFAGALFASNAPHDLSPIVTSEGTSGHADHHDQEGSLTRFTTNALFCQPCRYTGDPTNDLKLDGGYIQCWTCHGVHYADGNTVTEDRP